MLRIGRSRVGRLCKLRPLQQQSLQLRAFSSSEGGDKDKNSIGPADPNVASESFKSRWLMALPAFGTHLALGSPWAWSLMADAVTREVGFVAPAASDWTLYEAALPLSIVFLMQGVSAGLVGKWQMKVGARTALAASACAFGGGYALASAGVYYHSLPLLYTGYGLLAGTGIGLAYTPPVATLMEWFPDKKSVASGLTIAGFGSGALLFTPAMQYLMKHFAKMPEYLGPAGSVATKAVDGKLYAQVAVDAAGEGGQWVEAVQAGAAELAKLSCKLPEGLYAVGTGSTGAAEGLAIMGGVYFSMIMAASLSLKKPHPEVAKLFAPKSSAASPAAVAVVNVPTEEAMRAPQFWLLGTSFFCIATGGMGIMAVAKPMMSEVFSVAMPAVVTSAFASKFVLLLAAGNLGGRLGWAALSERIGRPATFNMFMLTSVPIYIAMPSIVDRVLATGGIEPLYGFCLSTAVAVSFMGGVFAILPAYEADLFGTKFVGPIHGRMLLFSSGAALIGPKMLTTLRGISEQAAITDLVGQISPQRFEQAFGAPVEQLQQLVAAKTVNISKLITLAPPGTLDPTPPLYDTTMYSLGGLMPCAVVAHGLVRPVKLPPIVTIDTTATVNKVRK